MASPRMCHRAALAVRHERGNGVEIQQQATCLSTLAAEEESRTLYWTQSADAP